MSKDSDDLTRPIRIEQFHQRVRPSKDSDDLMRRIDRPGNQMFDTESNRRHVKPPPLGIMPRWMHNELRRQHLQEAIWRYTIHEPPIMAPAEWIEELNELTAWLQNRDKESLLAKADPLWLVD